VGKRRGKRKRKRESADEMAKMIRTKSNADVYKLNFRLLYILCTHPSTHPSFHSSPYPPTQYLVIIYGGRKNSQHCEIGFNTKQEHLFEFIN
jgi:hypothetical protein